MTDTNKKYSFSSAIPVSPEEVRKAAEVAVASPANGQREVGFPDTEVLEKASRRRFTIEYKRRILAEADACTAPGDIGKLLRREGLYSSNLTNWRAQREQGIHDSLSRSRGRKPQEKNLLAEENVRLQKENQHLQQRLERAQTIIEVQKKLSQLLGMNENPVYAGNSS
jgi:transposase